MAARGVRAAGETAAHRNSLAEPLVFQGTRDRRPVFGLIILPPRSECLGTV